MKERRIEMMKAPNYISANRRNFFGEGGRERAPDGISANGRNLMGG